MAKTLATTLRLALSGSYINALDNSSPVDRLDYTIDDTLATGDGADQAELLWHDRRTLAATSEELDLAASLTDAFGATLTFATIKGIVIYNRSTTTAENLTVGGAASDTLDSFFGDATDTVTIGPSGCLFLWNPKDGYTVTASTGDKLKIDSGAATVIYDIVVIGTSA